MRVQDRPVYKLKAAQEPLKVEACAELLRDDMGNYSKLISSTLLQWYALARARASTHACTRAYARIHARICTHARAHARQH